MWQISYLPANGASLGNYFGGLVPNKKNIGDSVQKLLFLGKNRQNGANQNGSCTQTCKLFLYDVIRVCVDFFFKLNLLPHYLLCSQGDEC